MSVNLRLSIALVVLLVTLVACQTKEDATPTRQLSMPVTPSPVASPSPSPTSPASFTPTPRPPATATLPPPSSTSSPWPTPTPFANEITLEVIGQIGGLASAVAVKDELAYLGIGPQVLILDVSDPQAPIQIGQSGALPDFVEDIAVANNLVYVAVGEGGLHILDLSSPTNPRKIGFVPTESLVYRVLVQDNVAFVGESHGLRLIDVADPTAPREIAWLEGQMVDVQDGFAYINQSEGLQIFDISDPQAVRKIADTGIQNVSTVADGYAYTINNLRGDNVSSGVLSLVDISDFSQPQTLGSLELGRGWPEVFSNVTIINDSFVCAVSTFSGESAYTVSTLYLVDVSEPTEPRLVAKWGRGSESDTSWNSGAVADIFLVEGLFYLALSDTYADNGLWIVDVSDPTKPREVGSFNVFSDAHEVVRIGDYAYVTSGYFPDFLNLVDITDLSNIQDRGIILSVTGREMTLVDGYLYLTGYFSSEERIRVLDITDPTRPQILDGSSHDLNNLFSLSVVDTHACVVTIKRSLAFFDLSDPTRPRQIAQLDTEDIHQVICTENYAYYVSAKYEDDFSTLHVIDVSDLTKPHESSTLKLPKYVWDIASVDSYLYVIAECEEISCQGSELLVIDVSDEAHPRQVGALSDILGRYGASMSLRDHHAYIADGNLWVVDISDPTEPRPIGYMNTPGNANSIAVTDNTLFVSNGYGGLVILRVRD